MYLKTKTRRSTHPPSNKGLVHLKPTSLNNRNNPAACLRSPYNSNRRMSLVLLLKRVDHPKMKPLLLRRNSTTLSHVMRLNFRQSSKSTRKLRVSGVLKMSKSSPKRSLVTTISEMTSSFMTTSITRPSRICATTLL